MIPSIKVFGNGDNDGWDDQLPDQPVIQLNAETKAHLYGDFSQELQLFYAMAGCLGTLEVAANASLGFVYQHNSRPQISFSELNQLAGSSEDKVWGWFVYTTVNAYFSLYHTFADGRSFSEDDSVGGFRKSNAMGIMDLA